MVDFERARKAMVDNQLRTSAITDRRLLGAMGSVPRERFVPEERKSLAYIDEPHLYPGPLHRALPAPAPFARLVQLAQIRQDDAVLDVGCAAGYSSAVITKLAARVVAIEAEPALADAARANLAELGVSNVEIVGAPLTGGAPKLGPYDVIILEGAVAEVPDALLRQLKQGGRLVAYLRRRGICVANVFVRSGDDFRPQPEFDAAFPLLLRQEEPEAFVF